MPVLNRRSPYRNWRMDQSPGRSFTINKASPQYNGLVALWTCFGQNRGVVALRDEVSHFDMTAFNTPTISNSLFGPVVLFNDGATEYLAVTRAVLSGVPISIAAWVYTDEGAADQYVMQIADTASATNFFGLNLDTLGGSPGKVRAIVHDGTFDFAETTANWTVNAWHHVVAVFAANNSRAAYLDGGNKGTDVSARTPAGLDATAIGYSLDTTPVDPLSGMIAEVRVYNRAPSDAEVWALFAPATRWDLYSPTKRAFFMHPPRPPRYGFTNFQTPGIV